MRIRNVLVLVPLLAVPALLAQACLSGTCEDKSKECPSGPFHAAPDGVGGKGMGGGAGQSGTTGGMSAAGGSGTSVGGSASGGMSSPGGAANMSGGAGGALPPPCDGTKQPSEDACVIDDLYGIFVAPSGSDTDAGTKVKPVKTLAKAVTLAQEQNKRVYACAGTYAESLMVNAGVVMYGGFACPGSATPWSYGAAARAKVVPGTVGLALDIDSVSAPIVIDGFEFQAKDGVAPGESSVAARVVGSVNVSFVNSKFTAGSGQAGEDGVMTPYTYSMASALLGNMGSVDNGGAQKTCSCPAGDMTKGGGGGPVSGNGVAGTPAYDQIGGKGGDTAIACNVTGGSGGDGTPGPAGASGLGAATPGTLSSNLWQPSSGADGMPGKPGQGGGGGAGKADGGGGSGACGGCGGALGSGGKGGGASTALLSVSSTVNLKGCQLVAKNGGKGGVGAAGQAGQVGGGSGNGFGSTANKGCPGGNGGNGGAGGPGGGGAGGVSVGIVYTGTVPTRMDTTINLGTPGAKGDGGLAGTNDGIAGVAAETLSG